IVCPSFFACTTLAAPTAPPAPGRFTASTGTPSRCDISSAMVRAEISAASPGASGTTMLTGPLGNGCAEAMQAKTTPAMKLRSRNGDTLLFERLAQLLRECHRAGLVAVDA